MKMDRLYENAIRSLKKSQNNKRLFQILHLIRKNISTPNSSQNLDKIRRLQKEGCVKVLVQYLKEDSASEELINIILSIIGYACLQSEVAKEIIQKYQILPLLCELIENHNIDSVKGRIFRIIGNLCDGWNSNIVIEDTPQICKPLKAFFSDLYEDDETNPDSSPATISMALRASRKLLKKNTSLVVINEKKILQDIAAVFVKYSKQWIETKQNESILGDILKVVLHYSTFSKKEVVAQLRLTFAGDSLALLPELIPLNPQRILRIVMNLTMFCPNKSDLPILNMMVKLNRLALSTFERDQEQHLIYLGCISNLLDHPGHKEYVGKSGTIGVLLHLFSRHKAPSQHSVTCLTIIIDFLKKISTDQTLTQILINPKQGICENISPDSSPTLMSKIIDTKTNKSKPCRCNLKRDHSRSESTSTYNLRRNCHSSNCAMKLPKEPIEKNREYYYDADVDDFLFDIEEFDFLKLIMAKLRWLEIKASKIHLPAHEIVKKEESTELIDGICSKVEDGIEKNGICDFTKEDSGCFQTFNTTEDRCISPSTSDISSNGPYSPYRIIPKDDDSNSDDYSPICSDAEDSEAPPLSEDVPNSRDFNIDTDDTILFEEKYNKQLRDAIIELCCNINHFISILTFQHEGNLREKMASIELCNILLNASFQHIRPAAKTILKVVNTRPILMDFMFTDFISDLFEFSVSGHKDNECGLCDRAKEHCRNLLQHCTNIVEDGSFKPNILYRVTVQKKQTGAIQENFVMSSIILISANYVLKKYPDPISPCNLNLLKRILVTDEGSDVFISSLRSATVVSMHCLCKLVSNIIKIKNPRTSAAPVVGIVKKIYIKYNFKSENNGETAKNAPVALENSRGCKENSSGLKGKKFVTFILDDGTKVRTNRELLITKSDYFSRLLEGNFIESNQSEIRLKNVKRHSFRFLIYLLKQNVSSPCTFKFRHLYLDIILDVILVADLYLLPDIVCALTTYIENKVLAPKNLVQIYSWSINSHTNLLRIEVVAYLLSKEMQDQRVPMLQMFVDSEHWDTLVDDIASLVNRHLQGI